MKIIGIFLVHNEDIFFRQAVLNVIDFCDQILIADHQSTDRTWEIAQELNRASTKIFCQRIKRTHDSHEMIKEYAGSDTWVFGVDGDEIYDPQGLIEFRKEIETGIYDDWWILFGNVLNCTSLDMKKKEAVGHLAPPCRSMTKLYNFRIIQRWDGPCLERMLGGNPEFKNGYSADLRLNLHEQIPWEKSKYRCLHTCFLRRSSKDPKNAIERPNPAELASRSIFQKIKYGLFPYFNKEKSFWKKEKYLRGPKVTLNVTPFFPQKIS